MRAVSPTLVSPRPFEMESEQSSFALLFGAASPSPYGGASFGVKLRTVVFGLPSLPGSVFTPFLGRAGDIPSSAMRSAELEVLSRPWVSGISLLSMSYMWVAIKLP